jgi:hypothetical protein
LKQRIRGVPIIGMSGGGQIDSKEYLDLATALGASMTLGKPFSQRAILKTIAEVLSCRLDAKA